MDNKKYLIAVPCLDNVPVAFVAALTALKRIGPTKHSFLSNSLVYDARNALAKEAIDTGADRILFIDSDMYFQPDMMERMAQDLDKGADMVSGICVTRRFPTQPCIYKTVDIFDGDILKGKTEVYTDYPKDSLFPIAGCGFGAVMMNTNVLKAVYEMYSEPFNPIPGILGEDLSFCYRARDCGFKLFCDSRIKVGHVGTFIYTESEWLAQQAAQK